MCRYYVNTYMKADWLRRPRTTQERRANQDYRLEEEYRVHIRGRRAPHLLPEAWDDIPNRSLDNRNWKKLRKAKKQYKVKEWTPPE